MTDKETEEWLSGILKFKCPNCWNIVIFNPDSGADEYEAFDIDNIILVCDICDLEFSPEVGSLE